MDIIQKNLNISENSQTNALISRKYFTICRPSTWFSMNWAYNEFKIDEFESEMFKSIKSPFQRYFVKLSKCGSSLWTICINVKSEKTSILLLHGFCGGIGLWIHNIDSLSQSRSFYAFDLLGFGRSSRPKFSSNPIEAENQFVDSIEGWRKEMKLDKIILLGHSFGGYLATLYSIKYPMFVKALILADPWYHQ
jgi:abhydrolase domain-containing protein 4